MFLTLTCDSCGQVLGDGTPVDPASYDYQRAARDAIHFAALFDRFIQNLRRVLGYDAQYFAAVEPQRRLAPQVADCHVPESDAQRAHVDSLADALRFEPCSPRRANWLRYGIQPKVPGRVWSLARAKGKAHRPEHVGFAGRRVLVSRKWSGKTLAGHPWRP